MTINVIQLILFVFFLSKIQEYPSIVTFIVVPFYFHITVLIKNIFMAPFLELHSHFKVFIIFGNSIKPFRSMIGGQVGFGLNY